MTRDPVLLGPEPMIPVSEVTTSVPSETPACSLPSSDEISEEGFGYFRGIWFMGRVLLTDAESVLREEAEILEWLDQEAPDAEAFEALAKAIETQETDDVLDALGRAEVPSGLDRFVSDEPDFPPLGGLEVGVAGLCHSLSVVGCLTAASCRSHPTRSWSDCPVVFFRAPTWRVELLMDLISSQECGLAEGRGMLTIYAASVREIHGLARRILGERGRFRKMPGSGEGLRRGPKQASDEQLDFPV